MDGSGLLLAKKRTIVNEKNLKTPFALWRMANNSNWPMTVFCGFGCKYFKISCLCITKFVLLVYNVVLWHFIFMSIRLFF
jgi:hypothetical protein